MQCFDTKKAHCLLRWALQLAPHTPMHSRYSSAHEDMKPCLHKKDVDWESVFDVKNLKKTMI